MQSFLHINCVVTNFSSLTLRAHALVTGGGAAYLSAQAQNLPAHSLQHAAMLMSAHAINL